MCGGLIYLHEFKQQTGFDGNGEVIPSCVFAWNGRQEGVPDGTRPFHYLLQSGSPPHRTAFDPAALEYRLPLCRNKTQFRNTRFCVVIQAQHKPTGTYRRVLVRVDRPLQLDVAGWELWIWSLRPEFPLEPSDMIFCPPSPLDHSTT